VLSLNFLSLLKRRVLLASCALCNGQVPSNDVRQGTLTLRSHHFLRYYFSEHA
jgi:hypothetical protein